MAEKLGPELKAAISAYCESEPIGEEVRKESLPAITQALEKQQIELLDLVLFLDPILNDTTNPQGRRWAIMLLAECLMEVQSLRLNFKHIQTLVGFFCSRISDWQGVEGSAIGLLAIMKYHAPPLRTLQDPEGRPLASYIARSLFKEVNMQSHTQPVRKAVIEACMALMEDWSAEVGTMGDELGDGVNNVIEEERDPRNLLLSFQLVQKLFENHPSSCVTDMALGHLFEALTSYFPITFTPPKEDKVGITGVDLRDGLSSALASTPRFCETLLPFLLENVKDVTVGDNEESIAQALDLLGFVFERYGPKVTQQWICRILTTARDHSVRTETPCPQQFADMVRRALAVALSDVPVGLTPAWLTKEVSPGLKTLAEDAARGEDTQATEGARRLLLAAAAANPLLAERVWSLVVPQMLDVNTVAEGENPPQVLKLSAVTFVLALSRCVEGAGGKPLLSAKQMKSALEGSLASLITLAPSHSFSMNMPPAAPSKQPAAPEGGMVLGASASGPRGAAALLKLVGRLARLSGEAASAEAFAALCAALLPPSGAPVAPGVDTWAADWRAELREVGADDTRAAALLGAVSEVIGAQEARAEDLVPKLLAAAGAGAGAFAPPARGLAPWLQAALPRLLAETGLSLARLAATAQTTEAGPTQVRAVAAAQSASGVLVAAAGLVAFADGEEAQTAAALQSLAAAIDDSAVSPEAAAWAAEHLALAMRLPAELPKLCAGPREPEAVARRALAVRSLVRALASRLPADLATELRRAVLSGAAEAAVGDRCAAVALVPAALPALAAKDWGACSAALPAVCREAGEAEAALEAPALTALEALVESCPVPEVEELLASVRATFGSLLEAGGGDGQAPSAAARGAVRCWAAVAGGLLRRGGFAPQATAFLETLLGALARGALVAESVPLAFHVLMPPRFDDDGGAGVGIPPLAVQQQAFTALPSLTELAKEKGLLGDAPGAKRVMRAALQCAVALLCALPVDAARADFGAEYRWCVLAGLRIVGEDAASPPTAAALPQDAAFAVQVLQLLVRAAKAGATWVEDDLQTVVPHICAAVTHRVPLVRLGCMQALLLLVENSFGHLLPYKKSIAAATQRAVEDKRREVRLMGVAALNAWQCGGTQAAN